MTAETPGEIPVEVEAPPVTERWAYAGVRVSGGKRVHAWLADAGDGAELLFVATGTFAVGELYAAAVTRRGERVTLHGTPGYTGDGRLGAPTVAALLARHRAAPAVLDLARRERAAGREDELADLVAPLRTIMKALRTRPEREAFLGYLIRELFTGH